MVEDDGRCPEHRTVVMIVLGEQVCEGRHSERMRRQPAGQTGLPHPPPDHPAHGVGRHAGIRRTSSRADGRPEQRAVGYQQADPGGCNLTCLAATEQGQDGATSRASAEIFLNSGVPAT